MTETPTLAEAKQALRDCNLWSLHIGIHRGTLTSRDSEMPKPMASLQACADAARTAFREYACMGCQCWFCYAVGPDGQRHTLIESQPYH